jgi:hypothetical protein
MTTLKRKFDNDGQQETAKVREQRSSRAPIVKAKKAANGDIEIGQNFFCQPTRPRGAAATFRITTLSIGYPECHLAECHHAECLHAECLHAECQYAECQYAECQYAECQYAECLYAECQYAESQYAECQ